jgi:hypothetical protein
VAATARVGSSRGCGVAYKGRVDHLGVRAKATRRARAAAGRTRGQVRPGYARSGMTARSQRSVTAARAKAGWRRKWANRPCWVAATVGSS